MRSIFKAKIGFLFIFFLLIGSVSYGQDYNNQNSLFPQFPLKGFGQNQNFSSSNPSVIDDLPVPASTEETRSGLGQAYGLNLKMFSSQLSIREIKNFYQNRLPSSGWEKVDTSGMFSPSTFGKMDAPAGTRQIAKNSLIFQKGKIVLIVGFYPAYGNNQATVYSIAEKQVP